MIKIIDNNGVERQSTSKACEVKQLHELMRCYTLDFACGNNNPIVPYINKDCVIKADGQLFDITQYNINAGSDNSVSVSGVHVGYRLNNYKLATLNYSHVGTRRQIAQDILNNSFDKDGKSAADEFLIGICDDGESISFPLNNEQEVTAKYAIMALKNVGCESDFDNFTINFSFQMGTHTKEEPLRLKLGENLAKVSKSWDSSSGETYNIDIADKDLNIHVGDYVKFDTDWEGNTETKRIVTYTRYLDNPSKNSITVGNFVHDENSDIVSMAVDIDKSVKIGEGYNNTSITHKDGVCTRTTKNGHSIEIYQNATRGFEVVVDGVRKAFTDSETGHVFTDAVGNDPNNYGQIGNLSGGGMGLDLFAENKLFCAIAELVGGGFGLIDRNDVIRFVANLDVTRIRDQHNNDIFYADDSGTWIYFGNNKIYLTRNSIEMWFDDRNAVGVDGTGAFYVQDGGQYYFKNIW